MTRLLCIIVLLSFSWQCQDEANDPLTPSPTSTPNYEGDECPGIALDAFETHIQTAIDASCSTGGCHADDDETGAARESELELFKGEDNLAKNRAAMRRHKEETDNKLLIEDGVLLAKVGGKKAHGGGNQIELGHITARGITAWVKAEQKCSSND